MATTAFTDHYVEYSAVLMSNGQARSKQIDSQGHLVPVLILDAEIDSGLHLPLHIEQTFPVGAMAQAQAAARRYRKGQRITVQTPALAQCLSVVATHIHTHPDDTEPGKP